VSVDGVSYACKVSSADAGDLDTPDVGALIGCRIEPMPGATQRHQQYRQDADDIDSS
jgi:hypothetical protein